MNQRKVVPGFRASLESFALRSFLRQASPKALSILWCAVGGAVSSRARFDKLTALSYVEGRPARLICTIHEIVLLPDQLVLANNSSRNAALFLVVMLSLFWAG